MQYLNACCCFFLLLGIIFWIQDSIEHNGAVKYNFLSTYIILAMGLG